MARIDFSNAIIAPYGTEKPFSLTGGYWGINGNGAAATNITTYFLDAEGNRLTPSTTIAPVVLVRTPTKLSLSYTGTIRSDTSSGTSIILAPNAVYKVWEISNISYNAGDSFSFQLDFDITIS